MAKTPTNKHQPMYQTPPNPAAIRTKRYALDTKKYISLAMRHFIKSQLKWVLLPVALILVNAIISLTGVYPNIWIYIVILIGVVGYLLFWVIQFTGITQLEQYKPMFQKYIYEIDSRQILMKLNQKEGGVMKWDMIKEVYKDKNAYVMVLSRGQFIYLPYTVFNSEHDQKLFDRILKQKEFIKDEK
ncbi:YcxB family protein [Arundinibacter roseus]|uniref:YcxB family protein n=1 Tax=Arundinibacter roseus TaxID=2070510 RepID=A0A4R4JVY2_9BACT|nr:YcxB family protein [Arundinibacter roseus]TDB58216.1 YcxB family protein [Arundinibacter roseus]